MCCVFLGSLGPHHIDSVFDIVIEGQGFVVQHTVGTFERVWVLVTLMLHGEGLDIPFGIIALICGSCRGTKPLRGIPS